MHSLSNLRAEDPVEYFLASDASAIIEHTKRILFLQDDDVASIHDGSLKLSRGADRPKMDPTREIQTVELELHAIMKVGDTHCGGGDCAAAGSSHGQLTPDAHLPQIHGMHNCLCTLSTIILIIVIARRASQGSFEHFMLKEIYEQPESAFSTLRGRLKMEADGVNGEVVLGGLKDHISTMLRCRRLLFIACGTSYNSAIAARQWLEETTQLPVVRLFCVVCLPCASIQLCCFHLAHACTTRQLHTARTHHLQPHTRARARTLTYPPAYHRHNHCLLPLAAGCRHRIRLS